MRYVISAAAISFILLLFFSCYVPKRMVPGVYLSDQGDTLRLKENQAWRVEMANPDTSFLKLKKFTSGRWHKKRNRLFLTVAAESMGNYWQCVPMNLGLGRLRRPLACEGEGPDLRFKKVKVKPPEEGKGKKGKKGKRREKEQDQEN
jgi:hypothetical protein